MRWYGAASGSGMTEVRARPARRHTSANSSRVRSPPPRFTSILRSLR